jgi:putative ABC transport system permease protein
MEEIQKVETNSVELEYSGGGSTASERVLYDDYLTRDDEKAVLAQVPGVLYSSPILTMHDRISFGGGIIKDTLVLGVSPQYQQIRNLVVPQGRFLDETDDTAHIKCAVVTELFARERFGSVDAAVGQNFEISGIPFTIVGVFKESVTDFGVSEIEDQTILIPYSVARYFTGTENVNQIYFSMRTMDEVPDAAKEIVRIVRARHRPNSVYQAQTMKELLVMADKIMWYLTLLLVAVAAVTMAVGGVGIMNIMLVSVTERTREIGVRRAIGAKRRNIMAQFIMEAVVLCEVGGVIGVGLGILGGNSVAWLMKVPPVIPFDWIALGLGICSVVGVVFGTYPAWKAANLDPIESLRYE